MRMPRMLGILAAIIAVAMVAGFTLVPRFVDSSANRVLQRQAPPPSQHARALYPRLLVADLHADSLLWGRDLLRRNSIGHIDLPRLIEGHVGLQMFTVVSKVPYGLNIERNDDKSDMITLVALSQRWPVASWSSLRERALFQSKRLQRLAERSQGRMSIIKSRDDLDGYLRKRAASPDTVGALLGAEGAQVLEGQLRNVDVLFNAGFRMMAPTHVFDTEVGGSAHGIEKGGLTELGRSVISRMEQLGMLVDLAHASAQTIDDTLAIVSRPLVFSHGGVRGTCNNTRNLSDDQIVGIAASGGVIGIGYWETAVCGSDGRAIARAMRYTADLVGSEHVALGSDFDGAVTTPFDATGLIEVVDGLIDSGFSDEEITGIMGTNVVRVLRAVLP